MKMEIKEFEPHHLPALRELYLQSRKDSFSWLQTDSFKLEDFDRDSQGERIWLVEVSGSVAGFISIWEPEHFIHHLYVASNYQAIGIGSQLVQRAQKVYRKLSLKCMVPEALAKVHFCKALRTKLFSNLF